MVDGDGMLKVGGGEAGIGSGLSEDLVWVLVDEHIGGRRGAFERLWSYFRNELEFDAGDGRRSYRTEQEVGLPSRLTGVSGGGISRSGDGSAREIVIENDIAWRVQTLVDFMFGNPVRLESLVRDRGRGGQIERVLSAVFEANGGMCFFQELALIGAVYGFADVLVRADGLFDGGGLSAELGAGIKGSFGVEPASKRDEVARAERLAQRLVLETVEAPRAIPVLDPGDYRRIVGYVLHYTRVLNEVSRGGFLRRLLGEGGRRGRLATVEVTEVWTGERVTVFEDRRLVSSGVNRLGLVPVVHIQNLPQPLAYEGLSEVEPLIPLQDELNTRLSDRANRVTLQSFKMYLGRGIERFTERPIGPGQMWMTENAEASIDEFGGDADSPSEESHIREIREAMNKTSGVTPVAAGLLTGRVGNLTSATALRVLLMGLLSKTERKRLTYGKGIERLVAMILEALDVSGVFRTGVGERRVRLHWPSPFPENELERLEEAERKLRVGVPRSRVLAELGYGLGDEDESD